MVKNYLHWSDIFLAALVAFYRKLNIEKWLFSRKKLKHKNVSGLSDI